MENKGFKKSFKVGLAAAVAIVVAGVSIYATNVSAGESITESEAKQIALAEVKGADISNITKFQKDKDDGRTEYDVEIIYNGFEYDFEISAKDGTIFDQSKEKADAGDLAKLKAKQDAAKDAKAESKDEANKTVVVDQSGSSNGSSNDSSSDIGLSKAKSIALAQVSGASSGNITKAYKDYDDGRAEYDIEIRYNGYEYEFEISAASGKILSKDVDRYGTSGSSQSYRDYDDDDRYDRDDDDDWDDDRYDRDDDWDDDDDRYDD